MEAIFFNTIAQSSKHRHLLIDSAFIAQRKEKDICYLLFQKGSAYTEAAVSIPAECVIAVHTFSQTHLLEPYLRQISLPLFY